jgi:hypothetical protein
MRFQETRISESLQSILSQDRILDETPHQYQDSKTFEKPAKQCLDEQRTII